MENKIKKYILLILYYNLFKGKEMLSTIKIGSEIFWFRSLHICHILKCILGDGPARIFSENFVEDFRDPDGRLSQRNLDMKIHLMYFILYQSCLIL